MIASTQYQRSLTLTSKISISKTVYKVTDHVEIGLHGLTAGPGQGREWPINVIARGGNRLWMLNLFYNPRVSLKLCESHCGLAIAPRYRITGGSNAGSLGQPQVSWQAAITHQEHKKNESFSELKMFCWLACLCAQTPCVYYIRMHSDQVRTLKRLQSTLSSFFFENSDV